MDNGLDQEVKNSSAIPSTSIIDDGLVHIKTMEDWGGKYSEKTFAFVAPPWYVFHMSTMGIPCSGRNCVTAAQRIQAAAQRSSPFGGRYNFLIGGDGSVYEMRGWLGQPLLPKRHKPPQNVSILLGYIGRYDTEKDVPQVMRDAASRLIDNGFRNGYCGKNIIHKLIFNIPPNE